MGVFLSLRIFGGELMCHLNHLKMRMALLDLRFYRMGAPGGNDRDACSRMGVMVVGIQIQVLRNSRGDVMRAHNLAHDWLRPSNAIHLGFWSQMQLT